MTKWTEQISILSADEFEKHVKEIIDLSGVILDEFKSTRLEKLKGVDGEYEIDIVARFNALNTNFRVLIECKSHKNPIKRDYVQVLYDRLRSTGSQKGMLFSASPFQKGAIEFAKMHGIALIQIIDNEPVIINYTGQPSKKLSHQRVAGYLIDLSEDENVTHTRLGLCDPELIYGALNIIHLENNAQNKFRFTI